MRRRLFGGAAYLLIGAVTTLLAAWSSALWAQKPVLGATRVSGAEAAWPLPVDPAWPEAPNAVFRGRTFGYVVRGAHTLRVRQVPDRRLIEPHRLEIHDLGWPLPALRWHRRAGPEGMSEHHAIRVPAALARTGAADRRLPRQPRWGALVDVVFFAVLAWLAVGAPLAVQRAARAWRGACPACGYDLRASSGGRCPECGGATRARTRPRTPAEGASSGTSSGRPDPR